MYILNEMTGKVTNSQVHCFFSAQSSFTTKFLVEFCDKIRRTHTILATSKMQEEQNFLKKRI